MPNLYLVCVSSGVGSTPHLRCESRGPVKSLHPRLPTPSGRSTRADLMTTTSFSVDVDQGSDSMSQETTLLASATSSLATEASPHKATAAVASESHPGWPHDSLSSRHVALSRKAAIRFFALVGISVSMLSLSWRSHLPSILLPPTPESITELHTIGPGLDRPVGEEIPRQEEVLVKLERTLSSIYDSLTNTAPKESTGPRQVPVLREECYSILQRASPVNITFEPRPEEPLWFRWPNGTLAVGYVPDETALRRRHPPEEFSWNKTTWHEQCAIRDANHWVLTRRIQLVDVADSPALFSRARSEPPPPRAKIFCMVYTLDRRREQTHHIRETWGPKCDGFLMGSDVTDESIDAYDIPHEGVEDYFNMWQKVRSMWTFVYDHYYEKYDWFHMGGDDMYLIVENMRSYLESDEIQVASNGGYNFSEPNSATQLPLHLGRRMAIGGNRVDKMYNCGGSGYTLNKAALKTLVVMGANEFRHDTTYMEDVMVSRTLQKFGVFPYDTKDDQGGERYHNDSPEWLYEYKGALSTEEKYNYFRLSNIDVKLGLDHFANKSVAFHRAHGDLMNRFHALIYGLCPSDATSQTK